MEFLAAVLAIVALIFVLKMRKRVTELELTVAALSSGIQAAPQAPLETPHATESHLWAGSRGSRPASVGEPGLHLC